MVFPSELGPFRILSSYRSYGAQQLITKEPGGNLFQDVLRFLMFWLGLYRVYLAFANSVFRLGLRQSIVRK
jgi:hypothetical protein